MAPVSSIGKSNLDFSMRLYPIKKPFRSHTSSLSLSFFRFLKMYSPPSIGCCFISVTTTWMRPSNCFLKSSGFRYSQMGFFDSCVTQSIFSGYLNSSFSCWNPSGCSMIIRPAPDMAISQYGSFSFSTITGSKHGWSVSDSVCRLYAGSKTPDVRSILILLLKVECPIRSCSQYWICVRPLSFQLS